MSQQVDRERNRGEGQERPGWEGSSVVPPRKDSWPSDLGPLLQPHGRKSVFLPSPGTTYINLVSLPMTF